MKVIVVLARLPEGSHTLEIPCEDHLARVLDVADLARLPGALCRTWPPRQKALVTPRAVPGRQVALAARRSLSAHNVDCQEFAAKVAGHCVDHGTVQIASRMRRGQKARTLNRVVITGLDSRGGCPLNSVGVRGPCEHCPWDC
jgi:hypothetical protein